MAGSDPGEQLRSERNRTAAPRGQEPHTALDAIAGIGAGGRIDAVDGELPAGNGDARDALGVRRSAQRANLRRRALSQLARNGPSSAYGTWTLFTA